MVSARAAPRASSRSRQSLPVAERATPRNACGASTGKADAGSVMMLSELGAEPRHFNDSLARAPLATHLVRYPAKIPGDHIPVPLGLEIVFLVRTVLGRPRHEGGLQALFLRGLEVVVVGCDHHDFFRLQAEQFGRAEISFRIG